MDGRHPQWDTLAQGCSFYSSSRYLAYGNARSPESMCIEATADGNLVAGVPGWLTSGDGHPFLEPANVLADIGLEPSRYLALGSPWAFFGEFLLADAGSEQSLFDTVAGLQRSTDSSGALGLYIDDASGRRMATATGRQPLILNFDAILDVPASFPEYLAQLPASRRHRVRREITSFHSAGLSTYVEQIPDCVSDLAPLIVESEARHGIPADRDTVHRNLLTQTEYFPDNVKVFTARDTAGRLRGGVVAHLDDSTVCMRIAGIDRAAGGSAFEYFNLGFYAPLQYAMATGRTQVRLGMEAFQAKLLRGARLEPRWAVDLSSTPLWDDSAAKIWNKGGLARLDELLPNSCNPANTTLRAELAARPGPLTKG